MWRSRGGEGESERHVLELRGRHRSIHVGGRDSSSLSSEGKEEKLVGKKIKKKNLEGSKRV